MSYYETKKAATMELAQAIKAAGYRVFIAERGTYGFFTDEAGSRVVSFQNELAGFRFSGNYMSKSCGTGWGLGEVHTFDKPNFDSLFESNPPRWDTRGEAVTVTTLEQHLATYQKSSKYVEV